MLTPSAIRWLLTVARRATVAVAALGLLRAEETHAALVGRWSFDSSLADSSGNGNDFRLPAPPDNVGTSIVPGRVGNALRFDGAARVFNDSPGLMGAYSSFTLGAHVFVESIPTGAGDAAVLTDAGLQAGVTYHMDQRFYGYAGGPTRSVVSPSPFAPGAWWHVAQTYDGATRTTKLYVNGALVDSTVSQTPPSSIDISSLDIGRVGSGSFLHGSVDEAFLFDEVLTDAQIVALANPAASPARFWITPSGAGPLDVPATGLEVDLTTAQAGQTLTFDVWGRPESYVTGFFGRLSDVTLNVFSAAPDNAPLTSRVDFIDSTVVLHNPATDADGNPGTTPVRRFSSVYDGQHPPDPDNPDLDFRTKTAQEVSEGQADAILGLAGRNISPAGAGGAVGFGEGCAPGDAHCVMTPDGPVWRVATFGLQALPNVGTVDVRLQIGTGGMRHAGGLSAETDVIFAPPGVAEPVYNAGPSGDREAPPKPGETAELKVTVSDLLVGDYNADGRADAADYTVWRDRSGTTQPLSNRSPNVTGTVGAADYEAWKRNYGRGVTATVSLVGDYNADGRVDTADYTIWRDRSGTTQPLPNRSPNVTGPVGAADYEAWMQNYGRSGAATVLSVPEPVGLSLAATLLMTVSGARRLGSRRRYRPCWAGPVALGDLGAISALTNQRMAPAGSIGLRRRLRAA